MDNKILSFLVNRRQFLNNILPAGTLFYYDCGNLLASSQSGSWSKDSLVKHKFLEKCGMTFEELFRHKYNNFISTMQILSNNIGKDKFIGMLKEAISEVAIQNTKKILKNLPNNNFDTFIKTMIYNPFFKNTMTFEVIEQSDKVFEMKVTECLWAKTFRESNEPDAVDIGYAFVCHPEYATTKAFNPNIKVYRTKTLMQGHDCCNHRNVWEG